MLDRAKLKRLVKDDPRRISAIAEAAGIKERMLRAIITGERDPSFETFTNLVTALQVHPSELLSQEVSHN